MTDSNGDIKMLANPPQEIHRVPAAPTLEPEQPAGTVARKLNFQERSLLIFACRQVCGGDGKGDQRAMSKLHRFTKIISYDETVEYFDMIDDSVEDAAFRWQKERTNWMAWQVYQAGNLTLENLKKRIPNIDLQNPPTKPSRNQPEATPQEARGKERVFYLPSKIDAWVQDVIRSANWKPEKAEYVTELCAKFGISED